jgi:DNA primase
MLGKHFERARELEDLLRHGPRTKFLHNVDVIDFLEALEVENVSRSTADEVQFSCPFPGHTSGDATPSAYMNDGSIDASRSTYWKCFGCNRHGTAITFYAELEGISKAEAARHVRETWGASYRAPQGGIAAEFEQRLRKRYEQRNSVPFKEISWDHYDDLFGVDWEAAYDRYRFSPACPEAVAYMFKRGFTVKTLIDWNIGYDAIGYHGRLTIPVCNVDGTLIGVKGRAYEDARPKYKILGDRPDRFPRYKFRPYEKARVVFGLDRVKKAGRLVMCEGELDVIALAQHGIPAIAVGGAQLSGDQARLIRDYADEVVVFFDSNDAGYRATWGWPGVDGVWHPGLVERLAPFLSVRVVENHTHDASALVQKGRVRELYSLIRTAQTHLRFWT